MEKGERAHKALFVSSISFGQNKCSMKFLKNYTWIKRTEIAMCIFQNGWAWRGWCTRHLPIAYFWRHWRALIIESWLSYFSCWKDGHNSIPIFEPFLGFRSSKSEDWISEGKTLSKIPAEWFSDYLNHFLIFCYHFVYTICLKEDKLKNARLKVSLLSNLKGSKLGFTTLTTISFKLLQFLSLLHVLLNVHVSCTPSRMDKFKSAHLYL